MELLVPARLVKAHDLDKDGVEKIGDGRVVEGKVPVFTDAGADDVGRLGEEQVLIFQARRKRSRGSLAGDQAQLILAQSDQAEESLLEIPPERSGVVGSHPQV